MKTIFKIAINVIILSLILAICMPKLVWANDITNSINNTEDSNDEVVSENILKPTIDSAKIDANGKLVIGISNIALVSEVLINNETLDGYIEGNNYIVVDESLIDTTATITLKYQDGEISKSFNLLVGNDLNNENIISDMKDIKNVFTDGEYSYMYIPEYRTIRIFNNETENEANTTTYILTDLAIEEMFDKKYSLNDLETFECDNTDFVVANGVIYTIYTFDFGDGKNYVLAYCNMKASIPEWKKMALLPEECKVTMPSFGLYNGNLYVIGGYNESAKTISRSVYEFNLKSRKWVKKTDLPGGRFASTVNQVGDKLVLSFGGKFDGKVPCNLIYDGESWTKSTAKIDLKFSTGVFINKNYYVPSVGIVSGGLVYSGITAKKYGSIFYYDIDTDTFKESGYTTNNIKNTLGIAVGNKYYVFDKKADDNMQISVKSMAVKSGLSKLTVRYPETGIKAWINAKVYGKTTSNNNITNTYYYMPGDIVGFKLSDMPKYYYTHFKVDGQEMTGYYYNGYIGSKREIKVTKAEKANLVKLNKLSAALSCFNTLQLTATVTDKNATPVEWSCDNTDYATVSSTGLITPTIAGIGKTVTITATTTLNGRKIFVESKIRIIEPSINNLRITKLTNTSATLRWNAVKGVDGYEIFVYNPTTHKMDLYTEVSTNTVTIKNLKTTKGIFYGVRLYKTIDGNKFHGEMQYIS